MKTKTLVDAILKSGIKIHLKDNNQLKAILPPDFDDDILLQNIKDHKQEVIDYLQVKTSTISPMVMPTEEQEYYGLSNGQQRLWLVNKFLNGQHSLHNNVTKYHINKLDADCLEKAFNILIQRHEILRTNFFTIGGEPKQKIRDIAIGEFKFDFSDFTDMKGQKLNNKIDEHVKEEVLHPFDLQKDLPIRVKLLEIEKSNYVLLITIHHIANDGWSYNIMVSELLQIYSDLLSKTSPNLPPNTIHYRDYVKWQSNAINSEDEKYWLDTLSKDCESVHFHKDFISNQNNSFNGAYSRLSIASEQLEILKRYAVNHKTSLSNLVYSVFVLLLHKLTGQQEFVIGLTNANRNNLDLEKVVGFFINTLVINNQIQPDQSFDELLEHLSNTLFLAQKHQNYPYDKLIEKINPDRTVGSQSLYNVAYSYQNFADIATYDNLVAHEGTDNLHGLSIESQKVDFPLAEFDLNLVVVESDKGLQLTFRYNTDLFLEATVNKWLTHFELLVGQIIKGIESEKHLPIRQLHILDPSSVEYDQIVNTFNNTDSPLPIAKSIPLLFQEHVNLQGNKEAINFNGESISYQELDEFSNRIANFLLSQQTEIEDRVVIILDNSIELVASILGVLKAGGCYVCVDPKFPQKRIEFIINDTAPKTVISTSDTFEKLSLNKCESVKTGLVFDQQVDNDSARATHENRSVVIQIFDNESVNNCGNHHPEIAVEPSNLAYITYTSGSTGNPKGVLVEQKSVVRLVRNTNYFEIDNKDRLLQTATSSFDASTFEIWAPLLNGASLYITDQQTLLNAGRVGKYLKENAISVCWFTSSYFNRLVDIDPHIFDYLNTILVGGEALSVKHVNKVREVNNNLKIVNGYGPTENTTFSSCHLIEEEYSAEIPIGKPISNSKCYVLDSDMNVQPIGTPGYLFVGGTGLSRGYLNNPELTHQKFVDSPFTLGEKLYSTGDLAWWSDEGLLHYKGRLDHQVKIRGFRIEVDEVEHHLNSIKGIDKAVVIVEDDSSQEKYLSAYFTSKEDLKIEDIKVALSEVLPEYMIPSNLFHVDSFPLTINGKIDLNGLKKLNLAETKVENANALITEDPFVKELILIWQNVLNQSEISLDDDFFQLGGHSLKAVMLAASIEEKFQIEVGIGDIFENGTVRALSLLLKQKLTQSEANNIPSVEQQEHYPLSNAQKRLWILDKMEGPSSAYNMVFAYKMTGLKPELLKAAFELLLNRHESLRTRFLEVEGQPRQKILSIENIKLDFLEIDLAGSIHNLDDVKDRVRLHADQVFELKNDSLIRARLLHLGNDEFVLVLVIHHIISDGWSMEIIFDEIIDFYNALVDRKKTQSIFPQLNIHSKDIAIWSGSSKSANKIEEQEKYWLSRFSGEIPSLNLPIDFDRSDKRSYDGQKHTVSFDTATSQLIKDFCVEHSISLYIFLLSSLKVLFSRYTGQEDIILGTVSAGRNHRDLKNQIGYYLNTLALRTSFSRNDNFIQIVKKVKQTTLEAFDNEDYPFGTLVSQLSLDRDLNRFPLFDVLVALQNVGSSSEERSMKDVNIENFDYDSSVKSKFDLSFIFRESDQTIKCEIEYNTNLYDIQRIENIGKHLTSIAESLLADSKEPICTINYLQGKELEYLVGSNEDLSKAQNEAIVSLDLEKSFLDMGDAVALIQDNRIITYDRLNSASNKLANYIIKHCESDVVAIYSNRSVELIVAIIAILKAGKIFLPIDPKSPKKRVQYMLDDSGAKLLLTSTDYLFEFDAYSGEIFALDVQLDTVEETDDTPEVNISSNSIAYIIYTSGTTGVPKGVAISHKALSNYLTWGRKYYLEGQVGYTFGLFTSVAFDLTITSILLPLISGNQIKVYEDSQSVDETLDDIFSSTVSAIKLTPSHVNFLEYLDLEQTDVKIAILGGEQLKPHHVDILRKLNPEMKIFNEYGPTETTVGCTVSLVEKDINIGKPIENATIYILDDNYQLVPKGFVGEIYVGGKGLGEGYINNPEMTSNKFLTVDLAPDRSVKMYRTSDLGIWQFDGNIKLLGRKDNQVKIRGYRLELQEIESVIASFDGIEEACVYIDQSGEDDAELHAALVPSKDYAPMLARQSNILETKPKLSDKLYDLPNGMTIFHNARSETDLIYFEIFEDLTYLKHGISVPEGGVVFDVGANIGMFSLFVGLNFPGSSVYSFEPIPATYDLLEANATLYDLDIRTFNIGVSNTTTTANFEYYPNSSVLSGRYAGTEDEKLNVKKYLEQISSDQEFDLSQPQIEELVNERVASQKVLCQLDTLSNVIEREGVQQIDLLKIDVEKSELDVIRGIKEEDWQKIKQIVIEVHDIEDNLTIIETILVARGFSIVRDQDAVLSETNIYNIYASKLKGEPQTSDFKSTIDLRYQVNNHEKLIQEVTDFCYDYLPEYMVPVHNIVLDRLPINQNGKVDVRKIQQMANPDLVQHGDENTPEGKTEELLHSIWQDVLGEQHISREDSFFKIGGHSLNAVQVVSRISHDFNISISIADIFKYPSIKSLAQLLDQQDEVATVSISSVEEQTYFDLSHAQLRIWLSSQDDFYHETYTITNAIRLSQLDVNRLVAAFDMVVKKHEILRTTFKEFAGVPKQVVNNRKEIKLLVEDSRLSLPLNEDQIQDIVTEERDRHFDLEEGPLIRARLVPVGLQDYVLLLSLHHIISDGWSSDVLFKELLNYYDLFYEQSTVEGRPISLQYKDFVVWQKSILSGSKLENLMSFWRRELNDVQPLYLPLDYPRDDKNELNSNTISIFWNEEEVKAVKELCQTSDATLFMFMTAMIQIGFYEYAFDGDVTLGIPTAGRDHYSLEDQIGPYFNTIALRSKIDRNERFDEYLGKLREKVLSTFDHRQLPFDLQLECAKSVSNGLKLPLFDVGFTWQNIDGVLEDSSYLEHPNLKVEPLNIKIGKVKSDFWIHAWEQDQGIKLLLTFNSDLYRKKTAEYILEKLDIILDKVVENTQISIKELSSFFNDMKREKTSRDNKQNRKLNLEKFLTKRIS